MMMTNEAIIIVLVAFFVASHGIVEAFAPPSRVGRGLGSLPSSVQKHDYTATSVVLRRSFYNERAGSSVKKRRNVATHLLLARQPPSSSTNVEESKGPTVNFSLVRQTLFNQALIGWTIWTGGYGAQVLARDAQFDLQALVMGIVGVIPLVLFSRVIEKSESSLVADLNASTNLTVLRLFGDTPQPIVAFLVSALTSSVTGLVEETTFRGELLPTLARQYDSLPVGFVLSTLIFAVLHVNPISLFKGDASAKQDAAVLVAYQIVTGSFFATLFLVTGNLAVPIIAHALFDLYVFLGTHLQVTTQMQYARNEALMPVAPASVEAKWRQQRGDDFLLGARESFYLADSNRDGVLTRQELRIALYTYGIRLGKEESAVVTRAADRDQSGTIDFGEFLEFVGPTGSPGKAIKNSLLGVNG